MIRCNSMAEFSIGCRFSSGRQNPRHAREAVPFRNRVMKMLEERYLPDLGKHLVTQRVFTPLDFETTLNSYAGAGFSFEPIFSVTRFTTASTVAFSPLEKLKASPFTPFAVPVKIHLFEDYLASTDAAADEEEARSPRKVRTDSMFF